MLFHRGDVINYCTNICYLMRVLTTSSKWFSFERINEHKLKSVFKLILNMPLNQFYFTYHFKYVFHL